MPELTHDFTKLIRYGRKNAGLTQRAAAERLGVNFTYLSKIENSKIDPPSADLLLKMAALYDLPSDMLCVAGGKCPPDLLERLSSSSTFVTLVRAIPWPYDSGWPGSEEIA